MRASAMAKPTHADVTALVEQAQSATAQRVYLVDMILQMLIALNFAFKQVVNPKRVGVHRANRFGFGIGEQDVQGLILTFQEDGFAKSAIGEAIAFEDDDDRSNEAYTMSLCNDNPYLASFAAGSVDFASVACTHTNQALCCVIDNVATDHEKLAHDGRLSKAAMTETNEFLRQACEEGLEWLIIRRQVEKLWPTMPKLIQEVKNVVGAAQRRNNTWQTLTHIQDLNVRMSKHSGAVDWPTVQAQVLKTRPECEEDVAALCGFC
jgi:hypothetical protein